MNSPEPAQVMPFPAARLPIVDWLRATAGKHMVHGLMEVDVTRPRALMRQHRMRTGEGLSLTAFVAGCAGRAVAQHPLVHAYRSWRGDLVVFPEVDIGLPIEHDVDGVPVGTPHVIRAANRKTPREIHDEIRAVQAAPPSTHRLIRLYTRVPAFARRGYFWLLLRRPAMQKEVAGTVGLTAVGMFGAGGGWGIPLTGYTLQLTLGGISERPVLIEGRLESREYLGLTVTVDHDVVDGAPAARFARTLRELIERGEGLEP